MSSDFTGEDSRRPSSQRFDSARFESFSDYGESEPMKKGVFEEDFGGEVAAAPELSDVSSEGGDFAGDESVLPPPEETEAEEGFARREWRRQNVIRLEKKERREKEVLKEIIEEADGYKTEYYRKWKVRCENNRAVNREKEKLFVESREKFHAESDKSYWKAIAELIPKEVPVIEKKGKKPSILVIQGPKACKPTDLSRMRQILVKLKHKPPDHMMSPINEPGKDTKIQKATLASVSEDQAASAVAK